ncbi:hypothetical protein CCAE64S_00510 [Castellaniella caeni]
MKPQGRRPLRGNAFSWAWALCLALVLRALVPAGYMPSFANGELPTVTLCEMQGPGLGGMVHGDHANAASAYDNPLHFLAQCLGGAPLPTVAFPAFMALFGGFVALVFTVAVWRASRVRSSPLGSRAPPYFA